MTSVSSDKVRTAGSEPNEGRNALLAACSAALNLHAIAHHRDGPSLIIVGLLSAGEGRDVAAPSASIKVETRVISETVQNYVFDRAVSIIKGAAEMYGCTAVITKCGEAVNAPSDPELVRIIREAAEHTDGVRLTGDIAVVSGSDDACWFMKQVQDNGGKAACFALGTDMASGHHTAALISTKTACPEAFLASLEQLGQFQAWNLKFPSFFRNFVGNLKLIRSSEKNKKHLPQRGYLP